MLNEVLHSEAVRRAAFDDADKDDALIVVRPADNFEPGQYVAASHLCGCHTVCEARIEDD